MPAMAAGGEHAYVTLLLSDSYLPGALVLAHSLRDARTTKALAVMVTLDTVSANAITQLKAVYDHVIPVPRIRNAHPANLQLMNRGDLHSAFTKINLWKQLQFSKLVYIDADVVAYRAPDELFAIADAFAAAPDIGWPDLFNTGVMVLTPNMGDYYAMMAMAERGISFDGADQGLLNMHFGNTYNRISFTYNVTPSAHYQYIPAYRHFQSSISMVHFIGSDKPWFAGRHAFHGGSPFDEMVGRWWAVYDRHYRVQETPVVHVTPPGPSAPPPQQFVHAEHHGISSSNEGASSSVYTTHSGESSQAAPPPPPEPASAPQPPEPSYVHHSEPVPVHVPSWDAQWQPPPTDSKPEAMNLPTTHYAMSEDVTPFVPPPRYPSPPKNMWYEVPPEPPAPQEPPKPVFPWENRQPPPSRTFAPEPEPAKTVEQPEKGDDSKAPDTQNAPSTPSLRSSSSHKPSMSGGWMSTQLSNAWDEVPAISRYVANLQKHRRVRSLGPPTTSDVATTPEVEVASPSATKGPRPTRRGLKLTDFPTEVERPSLPVTPAPVGRSFWGKDDKDVAPSAQRAALPAAEGVPEQSEWDPETQLQKLAKEQHDHLLRMLENSQGGEDGSGAAHAIPKRDMPFGSENAKSPTYTEQVASNSTSKKPETEATEVTTAEPAKTTHVMTEMEPEATKTTGTEENASSEAAATLPAPTKTGDDDTTGTEAIGDAQGSA